jgi:DNA-binding NtrC family response regulator
MCPEKARIFLVEDDPDELEEPAKILEPFGHTIVLTATTLDSALEQIPNLQKSEINVAIIDGNLTDGVENGKDGEAIANAIHDSWPTITVIGHSLNKNIRNADYNCPKCDGPEQLLDTITKA